MTTKQYKRMCRVRVNRLAKLLSYAITMSFFYHAASYGLNVYATNAIGITIWYYIPDIITYVLEAVHKIKHDHVSYR